MSEVASPTPPSPDLDAIRGHIQALFGAPDQFADGLIEIAWTDPSSGALSKAQLFDTGDLERAAQFAVTRNKVPGCNVYVGAMLRDPDCPPAGRADDAEVYAGRALWVDLDDGDAVQAAKRAYSAVGIKPSIVVVTGSAPTQRAQLWYLLEDWTDAATIARLNAGLIQAFPGADTVVNNPSRVMRLAGTVSYPGEKKIARGYRVEQTRLALNTGELYAADRIERVFPYDPSKAQASPQALENQAGASHQGHVSRSGLGLSGRVGRDDDVILSMLEATRKPGHWHHNMRDAVATLAGRGLTEFEIRMMVGGYCDQGAGDPDLGPLIRGAMARGWGEEKRAERESEWDRQEEQAERVEGIRATPVEELPETVPPREWVYGFDLIRKFVTVYASPGGIGKTALLMTIAASICTGESYLGPTVHKQGRVWYYNLEDPQDELVRRKIALQKQHGIESSALAGRLFLDSGRTQKLIVAEKKADGSATVTADVPKVIEECKTRGIDVLIIDPVLRSHRIDENDNGHMDLLIDTFAKIADEANCAVVLVQHTRKGFVSGDMDSLRGGSAIASGARAVFTVAAMSEEEAEEFAIPEHERRSYIFVESAKANLSKAASGKRWIRLNSVKLGNGTEDYPEGDTVQAAIPWKPPATFEGVMMDTITKIMDDVVAKSKSERPYGKKLIPGVVQKFAPVSDSQAKRIAEAWFKSGCLFEEPVMIGGREVQAVYVEHTMRPDRRTA